jgi:hypothetical protein
MRHRVTARGLRQMRASLRWVDDATGKELTIAVIA